LQDTENVTRSVTETGERPAGSSPVTQPDGYVTIGEERSVFIGDLRVSKADGSQSPDPQRDTPAMAGVIPEHLDEDHDSGRKTDRPGSAACLAARRSQ
jgi:hypothetical protein